MRVLAAFDKFKDSLSARQACELAARALRSRRKDWEVDLCPLTDGGEGFAEILTRAAGGELAKLPVAGPRGGQVEAAMGLVSLARIPASARAQLGAPAGAGRIAIADMASASGLALLPPEGRDPWQASSYGTGQLIRAAAELKADLVLLGVGGSATNDLGLGALSALGFEFRSAEGAKLRPPIPAVWPQLARIEGELFAGVPPIRIACDVSNPLLGPHGATAVFGPQKGLDPRDYDRLEGECARLAYLLADACRTSAETAEVPGAGAAGGIAYGLMTGARARLLPGSALVGAWLDLEPRLAAADLVLTGEGRFDASSLGGKGPGALAQRAAQLGKPVHVFAGKIDAGMAPAGLRLHPITPAGQPLAEALRCAADNLVAAVQEEFGG
ncbi:MAG TPA: glycerate kinase [Opitutaceae bacterium]|nr:glycerate kinase [Opitutaceae bacterium]